MTLSYYKEELKQTAACLAKSGKGILAVDESTKTIGKRLNSINLENTEENRKAYRGMLFTTKGLGKYISGAILFEETLYQNHIDGEALVKKLEKQGKLNIKTKFQLASIEGDKNIKFITIKNDEEKTIKIDTDYILGFFGLIMQLGPIAEWGLNMNRKTISVNTENFETNKKGIFAIGDICTYPGKERLILSGFHEAALASVECFKRARPNEKYRFQFTTSSKEIQERLGRKTK